MSSTKIKPFSQGSNRGGEFLVWEENTIVSWVREYSIQDLPMGFTIKQVQVTVWPALWPFNSPVDRAQQ